MTEARDESPSVRARREVALVLLGGLIAAIAGVGGALLGANATIATQRDTAREQRLAEARDKRASTYAAFLAEVDRFAAIEDEICPQYAATTQRGECNVLGRHDSARGRRMLKAVESLATAQTSLEILGTQRAVETASALRLTLPRSGRAAGYDRFETARQAFLSDVCHDVSPDPRPNC